jgi:crossover junction endodeoxyribonuclease RuvC
VATTRIIGIDPGSQCTGVGIVDADSTGRATHVFHGALHLLDNPSFAQRLKQIFVELGAIIDQHRPDEVAIERVFMAKNADSALKLGQARGAALCAAVSRDLAVTEYAPKEIKNAIVGTGSADKRQVQHMVRMLLKIPEALQGDAADALAIALTHAHTRSTTVRIGVSSASLRRRRR